ncbi:DUF397 domain-containing protein [Streptomyces sp. NBC_01022]|uniref:DUF397 domain-containing protein n=1 Tax=Streptomyces sp. NBC_01022 TaxID=2903723 RepID=UPI002DD8434D|nr:DUF397 domain-containing protein [Streptomyces sp. NBC_01022]WRZ81960.1 DUF397 domain-containing protein [Streptomyces sp. NBC_01022]
MTQPPPLPQWRKSSYSNGTGGECVEVAELRNSVGLRDSKQHRGPRISVTRSSWLAFVSSLGHG